MANTQQSSIKPSDYGIYGGSQASAGGTITTNTSTELIIFLESFTRPATPTGGTIDFQRGVFIPPLPWLVNPPASPVNTVWISTAIANSVNTTIIWNTPGQIASGGGGGGGVTGLAGTLTTPFLTGQIRLLPGSNVTIAEDAVANTITFNSTAATASGYIQFVSSPTGSTNQQFGDSALTNYTTAVNLTLMVNGVALTPLTSYNLTGPVLTVFDYLPPNSILQVIAKSFGSGGGGSSTIAGLPVTNQLPQANDFLQVNSNASLWITEDVIDGGNY